MVEEYAYAKINLKLSVLGKRIDGFHEVDTIMQTLELHDHVSLYNTVKPGITIECNIPWLDNCKNLAWRAANLLAKEAGIVPHVKILLQKKIFIAAGLAGGSADAAAVLRGCNKLWGLDFSLVELEKIGSKLGSDIPFLIQGGRARATGKGEILTPLFCDKKSPVVVIVKPRDISISTKWAYDEFDKLSSDDYEGMENVLEAPVFKCYPVLEEIKQAAVAKGARVVMMSGSGPTIFSLLDNGEQAAEIIKAVKKFNVDIVLTRYQERIGV